VRLEIQQSWLFKKPKFYFIVHWNSNALGHDWPKYLSLTETLGIPSCPNTIPNTVSLGILKHFILTDTWVLGVWACKSSHFYEFAAMFHCIRTLIWQYHVNTLFTAHTSQSNIHYALVYYNSTIIKISIISGLCILCDLNFFFLKLKYQQPKQSDVWNQTRGREV